MFESLYGILATLWAAIAGLAVVFFYGKSKGKEKVERQVERKEAAEVQREAKEYREAVEHRQKIDEEVRNASDEKAREDLRDWVDYKPGDRR